MISCLDAVFATDLNAVSPPINVVKQEASLTLSEKNCVDAEIHFSSGVLCEVALTSLDLPDDVLDIRSSEKFQKGFYSASVIDGKIAVLSSFAATHDLEIYKAELNQLKSLISQKKAKVNLTYIGNRAL